MAFFKFRKGEGESVAKPAQSESVEAMRRRARQRLIGAGVLVLAGVVGFPLLFDTQPRPVSVDIPIEIPDRHQSGPLGVATAPVPAAPAAPAATPPAASVAAAATPAPQPAAPAVSAPAAAARSAPARPEPRAESRAAAPSADDGARARALLEGRQQAAPGKPDERLVVQVGAFAEAGKAREVRQRLERAGVKTYVHVAETKDGPRIRVRVGPFSSRAEADRAAEKIKGLDLPAAILTL